MCESAEMLQRLKHILFWLQRAMHPHNAEVHVFSCNL